MSAAAERKRRAILFRGCLEAGGLRGRGGHLSSRVGLIKMASEMDWCALNQSLLVDMFEDSFNGSNPNGTTIEKFLVNVKDHCEHVLLHKWISIIVPIIFAVIVLVGIGGNILVLLVVILKQQMRNTTNVLMLVSIRIFAPKSADRLITTIYPPS